MEVNIILSGSPTINRAIFGIIVIGVVMVHSILIMGFCVGAFSLLLVCCTSFCLCSRKIAAAMLSMVQFIIFTNDIGANNMDATASAIHSLADTGSMSASSLLSLLSILVVTYFINPKDAMFCMLSGIAMSIIRTSLMMNEYSDNTPYFNDGTLG